MDLAPGTLVTTNVRLVHLLGQGGMGSVWVADHLSLNTRVAVKFVSAELYKSRPAMVERFNREAALCAQIKSPHVVQTFDHGVMDDGQPFIVMELLEGESLRQRLERVGRLTAAETLAVVTQAAKALGKAHKIGVVHRDIKPDNLFLVHEEEDELLVKVLDFGIAKQTGIEGVSSMTSTGTMVGTPEYMSPEQVLSAKTVDYRCDLWALSVVAYHCLTGAVPFRGETLGSLCVAIANAVTTPPSELRPELPPSLDAWFAMALAADPGRRQASAKALASSFARAVGGEVVDDPSTAEVSLSGADASGPHDAVDPLAATVQPNAIIARAATAAGTSPTFAGTSVAAAPQRSRSLRLALLGVAAVLLVAGGGAAFLVLGSDRVGSTGAASSNQVAAGESPSTVAASGALDPGPTTPGAGPSSPVPSSATSTGTATETKAYKPPLVKPPSGGKTALPTAAAPSTTGASATTAATTTKDRGF